MILINLLPYRAARTKETIRQQISVFILSVVFVAIAMIYYSTVLKSNINSLNVRVKDTQMQIKRYEAEAKEVDRIKKELGILREKMKVISNLELYQKEPVILFDTMTNVIIHNRMWFTKMWANGNIVNIEGIAIDYPTVSDFMKMLESASIFSSVNLTKLQQEKIQDSNLQKFIVACSKAALNNKKDTKKAVKSKKS